MIKAVGERNVIVRNPSHEILNSVADPSAIKEFDSNQKILDVASAFTTDNQSKTAANNGKVQCDIHYDRKRRFSEVYLVLQDSRIELH